MAAGDSDLKTAVTTDSMSKGLTALHGLLDLVDKVLHVHRGLLFLFVSQSALLPSALRCFQCT